MDSSAPQLPVSVFEAIFRQDGVVFSRDEPDKRKNPRLPISARTALVLQAPGAPRRPQTTRIRDLSTDGIGLIHSTQMRPGDVFLVRLPLGHDEAIWASYTVTRCVRADDFFAIGGKFRALIEVPSTREEAATAALPDPPAGVAMPFPHSRS